VAVNVHQNLERTVPSFDWQTSSEQRSFSIVTILR
jgi:hypothetical protein